MGTFRNILVGVDLDRSGKELDRGSRASLRMARLLARPMGAEIVLFHSSYERTECAEGEDSIDAAAREASAGGVPARIVRAAEPAWLGMIHCAMRGDVDLVVVGKRAEDDSDGRRLGTNAVKLLRKCPVPVWVVPPDRDGAPERVLVATELGDVGRRAIRHAVSLATLFCAELHVVHAYQIGMQLQLESSRMSAKETAARIREIEEEIQRSIEESVREAGFEAEARIHVACNTPSRLVRAAVDQVQPDLLVMGSLSHSGVAGMLVGHTAEKLLDQVDCPLLTIKPVGFVSPVPRPAQPA